MLSLKFASACSLRLAASATATATNQVTGNPSYAANHPNRTRNRGLATAPEALKTKSGLKKRYKELLDGNVSIPEAPKKPPGPWIRFCHSRIQEFTKVPNRPVTDTAKQISQEYRLIDKSALQARYVEELEEYKRKKHEFLDSLTLEQHELLAIQKELKKEKATTRKLDSLKPPTRPRLANNIYFQERFKDPQVEALAKREHLSVAAKKVYAEYKNLSEAEREKYNQLAEQDKERYKREFDRWYEGVMADAQLDNGLRARVEKLRERMLRTGNI